MVLYADGSEKRQERAVNYIFAAAVITAIIIFSFFLSYFFRAENTRIFYDSLVENLVEKLENRYFAKYQKASVKLAESPYIIDTLNGSRAAEKKSQIVINSLKENLEADIIYIMDPNGDVISSTEFEGVSLKDENYAFRPYFTEAIEGGAVVYPAVGVTTGKRGIYFSAPVKKSGEIKGAAVIKAGLLSIDRILEEISAPSVLISPEGIIFASNREEFMFRSLHEIGEKELMRLNQDRQFAGIEIEPLSAGGRGVVMDGVRFRQLERSFPIEGWKVVCFYNPEFLLPLTSLQKKMILAVSGIIGLIIMLAGLSVFSLKRKKYAEKRIVENEKNLRNILNTTSEGFVQLNKKNIMVDVNPALSYMTGYSKKELLGEPFSFIARSGALDLAPLFSPESGRGRYLKIPREDILKGKNGKSVYVMISATSLSRPGGGCCGAFALITDISVLKDIQHSIKYRLEFEELAAQISADFINISIDELDKGIERGLMDVAMFADAVRGDVLEFSDKENTVSITHEWCESSALAKKEKLQNEDAGEYEYYIKLMRLNKDSSIAAGKKEDLPGFEKMDKADFIPFIFVPMYREGRLTGGIGFYGEQGSEKEWPPDLVLLMKLAANIISNALDRKQKEGELRRNEEKFRNLSNEITDGVAVSVDGKFVWANKAFGGITGYGIKELAGKDAGIFLKDENERLKFEKNRKSALNKGADGNFDVLNAVTKNGEKIILESGVKKIRFEGENAVQIVIRNITGRVEDEQKLKEALEELKHSNEELEQFAYIASHDLKEPLRMVSSYVKLLQKRYKGKLDDDADDFIEFAVSGAERMAELINDLLEYSRVGVKGAEFEPVDMRDIIDEALMNLKVKITEADAEIKVKGSFPEAAGDRYQLCQVVQNLVMNALKFTPQGRQPVIEIEGSEKNGECAVSVKDNGIGISKDYFDKIFVIFQQLHTKDEYPGTGIGLAVCRKIIERHSGRIWVESEGEGKGSAFIFTLPKNKNA
ncbi:MAG: ATP-binding protein [Candidatus Goldiibacteriota bacterium]